MLNELRKPVLKGQTRSEKWRRLQLNRLDALFEEHENDVINALQKDLGKPPTEAFFEIIALKQELKLVQKNLSKWMVIYF